MSFLFSEDKHNNRLDSGRLQWLLRVIDVLKGDAIELSFVDVRHTVVFPTLACGDGRFKIILDANIGYAAIKRKTINLLNNAHSVDAGLTVLVFEFCQRPNCARIRAKNGDWMIW